MNSQPSEQQTATPVTSDNVSLNFVWVSKQKHEEIAPLDTIPKALLGNVTETARAFPEIPMNIWIDMSRFPGQDLAQVAQDAELDLPPNISLRDITTVPAYTVIEKYEDYGDYYSENSIWKQMNRGRVQAVRELLETQEYALYADMDKNVAPHLEAALGILEKHGAVVGLERQYGDLGIENQFFGFHASKKTFLDETLLNPDFESDLEEEYDRFIFAFDPENTNPHGFSRKDIEIEIPDIPNSKTIKHSYQPYFSGTPPDKLEV